MPGLQGLWPWSWAVRCSLTGWGVGNVVASRVRWRRSQRDRELGCRKGALSGYDNPGAFRPVTYWRETGSEAVTAEGQGEQYHICACTCGHPMNRHHCAEIRVYAPSQKFSLLLLGDRMRPVDEVPLVAWHSIPDSMLTTMTVQRAMDEMRCPTRRRWVHRHGKTDGVCGRYEDVRMGIANER